VEGEVKQMAEINERRDDSCVLYAQVRSARMLRMAAVFSFLTDWLQTKYFG
jgi:hypothetical protein